MSDAERIQKRIEALESIEDSLVRAKNEVHSMLRDLYVETSDLAEVRKRIESELGKANEGRYATLLEDDRTEGYIAGLEMALQLMSST